MNNVVSLEGVPILEEIPATDTPCAVLTTLLAEIEKATAKPVRIVIMVELGGGYFRRASLMTHAEEIALLAVGSRMALDELLDD